MHASIIFFLKNAMLKIKRMRFDVSTILLNIYNIRQLTIPADFDIAINY